MLGRIYRFELHEYPYSNLPRASELYQRLYDITGDEQFLLIKSVVDGDIERSQ